MSLEDVTVCERCGEPILTPRIRCTALTLLNGIVRLQHFEHPFHGSADGYACCMLTPEQGLIPPV